MNDFINNVMHKVVVPFQFVLAVASLTIQIIYTTFSAIVDMTLAYIRAVIKLVDESLRKFGTGLQSATAIMKQALLKDYSKDAGSDE